MNFFNLFKNETLRVYIEVISVVHVFDSLLIVIQENGTVKMLLEFGCFRDSSFSMLLKNCEILT